MAWILAALYCLSITPLRLGADLSLHPSLPRAAWGLLIWGLRIGGRAEWRPDAAGRGDPAAALTEWLLRRQRKRGRRTPRMKRLRAVLLARPTRRLLQKSIRVRQLTVTLQIGGDAARAALLTGVVRAAAPLLPRARIRCRPAFGGKSALHARCIVETRLGTLMAAGLLGWLSCLWSGRKEEQAWNIPSGT